MGMKVHPSVKKQLLELVELGTVGPPTVVIHIPTLPQWITEQGPPEPLMTDDLLAKRRFVLIDDKTHAVHEVDGEHLRTKCGRFAKGQTVFLLHPRRVTNICKLCLQELVRL